jgi:argininosuccinate lyase
MEGERMRTDVVRLGRLSGERTGEMTHFLSSMRSDRCIADADILVDLAHVLMLKKQKIIDTDIAKQLVFALLELYDNGVPEEVFDERFEDVHAGIESLLVDSLGIEAGGRMHMGRSRNDEVATCIRIKVREELLKQMSALLKVRSVLIALSEEHINSVMPGFTHMQHAQPTTLAHHLLSYEQAFSRDFDRLKETYVRVNQSPLGAAAFASTGYPINREFTAELLGFDGLVTNTMDAVATRDFALETLANLCILMTNTSRLCEELVIWSSSFVKFVSLDDAFCSTSSIMPQKKNPDSAEIMRARTGSVFGAYTAALTIVKGLPMSYNRDLQELTPHLWRGLRDTKESTRLLIDMLASAEFNSARMKEEAGKGFSTATDLADTLVRSYDIPFRTAHSIVGRAVQKGDLSPETLDDAAREVAPGISLASLGLTGQKIRNALEVSGSVALRKAPGGPAPSAIKTALSDCRQRAGNDTALVEARLVKLKQAKDNLVGKARRLVA